MFGKRKRSITRVMVVEDEPLVAFDAEHFLADHGFEIAATVDSVAEALAVIARPEPIHLALVDLYLVDGSGVEVARAARDRGMLVLFVTGNCPGEARELAAGCLAKPFATKDLSGAIDALETVLSGGVPRKLPPGFSLFLEASG